MTLSYIFIVSCSSDALTTLFYSKKKKKVYYCIPAPRMPKGHFFWHPSVNEGICMTNLRCKRSMNKALVVLSFSGSGCLILTTNTYSNLSHGIISASLLGCSFLLIFCYTFYRPGQTRFREKWLKDIIESKLILMSSITF